MRNAFAAFFLAALPLAAQAGASAPCDCIDKGDIKVRMKRATAAIDAYGKELPAMMMTLYSTAGRVALQKRVDAAMSATNTPGRIPLSAGGRTSNSCDIEVDPSTKCLEAAIRAHEKVHQDACRATWDKHHVIFRRKAMDRFEAMGMTMAGYMVEEVTGYQAELMFLANELNRLSRDCNTPPPPDRDYSSPATHSGADAGAAPPPRATHAPNTPKPITAKPMVKPKPLPEPTPLNF